MSDPAKRWKEYYQKKILPPDQIERKISEIRSAKKTIATLNGSFDLLHAGHLFILYEASLAADLLIVAVNSDASVKKYKDPQRPIVPLKSRMEMLCALSFVDYVTWFDETDPRTLLTKIKPDVHVNGAEYGENCIEAATVKTHGGKILLVPRIDGLATSDILKKIQELDKRCV